MDKDNLNNFYFTGDRIRKLRKEHGWTQKILADKTGLSEAHISNLECGHTNLGADALKSISEVFGVTTDSLLYEYRDFENEMDNAYIGDIISVFKDCNAQEKLVLLESLKSFKMGLRRLKHLEKYKDNNNL